MAGSDEDHEWIYSLDLICNTLFRSALFISFVYQIMSSNKMQYHRINSSDDNVSKCYILDRIKYPHILK